MSRYTGPAMGTVRHVTVGGTFLFGFLLRVGAGAMAQQAPAIALGREVVSFGVESGDPIQEIGKIRDVEVTEEGTVFLLDGSMARVLAIGSDGTLLTSFGRQGRGPREFAGPVAMAIDDSSKRLYVLDPELQRITVLEWDGHTLAFQQVLEAPAFALDLCVLNGKVLVYAPSAAAGPVLEAMSNDGTRLGAFGESLVVESHPGVRMMKRGGKVLCLTEMILLAGNGQIRGYDENGHERYHVLVPGYRGLRVLPTARGARIDPSSPQPSDVLDNVFRVGRRQVGVQLERVDRTVRRSTTIAQRLTFMLDASTGRIEGRQQDLPKIARVTNRRVYVSENDPYPRLRIMGRVAP